MIYLVFILGFLQIADVLTTEKILQNGKELNPVMNWLFTKFGTHTVLVLKYTQRCLEDLNFLFPV